MGHGRRAPTRRPREEAGSSASVGHRDVGVRSPREPGLGCPMRAAVLQAEAALEGTGPARRKARERLRRWRRAPGPGRTPRQLAALTALIPCAVLGGCGARKLPSKEMSF